MAVAHTRLWVCRLLEFVCRTRSGFKFNKNLNASLPLSGNYYCIKCPDGSRGTHFTHELYLRKFWKAKRLKISTLRCHRVEITVLNARTDQGELISQELYRYLESSEGRQRTAAMDTAVCMYASVVVGCIGLLWLEVWRLWKRTPPDEKSLQDGEAAEIAERRHVRSRIHLPRTGDQHRVFESPQRAKHSERGAHERRAHERAADANDRAPDSRHQASTESQRRHRPALPTRNRHITSFTDTTFSNAVVPAGQKVMARAHLTGKNCWSEADITCFLEWLDETTTTIRSSSTANVEGKGSVDTRSGQAQARRGSKQDRFKHTSSLKEVSRPSSGNRFYAHVVANVRSAKCTATQPPT